MSVFEPDDFDDYDYYDEFDDLDDLGAGLPPDDDEDHYSVRERKRSTYELRRSKDPGDGCSGGCCGIFLWIAIIVAIVMGLKSCIGG